MPKRREPSYYDVLTAAVEDMLENGFDSAERVSMWMDRLKAAAQRTLKAPYEMERLLREGLMQTYRRYIDEGQILRYNFGVSRFTLDKVRPQLRAELDRRIMASASLIKLNRTKMLENTLSRFQGWATSIPLGGSDVAKRKQVKLEIKRPLASAPFEERRVLIDQGHKLMSSLNSILATDAGAIAAIWHSHWKELNYNYRLNHKARDQNVYTVPGNWAIKEGIMRAGKAGYTNEITQPAEEPFCRCFYQYIYSIDRLPDDMITGKGRKMLESFERKYA